MAGDAASDPGDPVADPTPDALLGRLVDERYRILVAMASGAMGAVYKAERVPIGKLVAIKFLHKSYAKDAEFLTRFERETRAMSKLAHPNCVSVVDFGVWEDAPYLVMDYVAGTTLRAVLDRGKVAPIRALALARQIAAGLAHAHAQGIVHRDIKPANIMITDEIGTGEHVRLLDFGLARLRGAGGRDATQTNVVVGTPNYMAPEQTLPGMTVDPRTDVYALGVVLYEMLVGERPFSASDTMALLGMHRAAPIPRLADRIADPSELPDGTQAVIDTAMAKSPDDRYQSAVELADAIDGLIDGGRPEAVRAATTGARGVKRASAQAAAVAPTIIDEARLPPPRTLVPVRPVAPAGWRRLVVGAVVLVVGVAGGAALLIHRHASETANASDAAVAPAPAPVVAVVVDAEPLAVAAPIDSAVGSDAGVGSDAAGSAAGGSGSAAVGSGSAAGGSGSAAGGSDSAAGAGSDIEIDPATAEDFDPGRSAPKVATATEEAADAPATAAEAVHKAPPPPHDPLAATVTEAVEMIKAGKHDLALHSLLALSRKQPGSAYIPFLLGNLYYDQLWWGAAMDDYREAIIHNTAYRTNAVLNHNVIRMLASEKTQGAAAAFLRKTIGRPALPFLKAASQHEDNPTVRKQAGNVAKQIK